jgi:hypothetical protein
MLAHHGKDVPMNLFTLCELKYQAPGMRGFNRKGLLRCNEDMTVAGPKLAYFAAQRVFAVFDDTLERIRDLPFTPRAENLAVFGYRKIANGATIVTVWSKAAPPADSGATSPVDLTIHGVKFNDPVYADLLTGEVRAVPPDRWSAEAGAVTFQQMPIHDSPILISERSALPLESSHSAGSAQNHGGGPCNGPRL